MDDTKAEALHIMIAAQGLLIEHLWAQILASHDPKESEAIKDALIASAGNAIAAYSGGPADVEVIQQWGGLVQQHMRDLVASIQRREELARRKRSPPP